MGLGLGLALYFTASILVYYLPQLATLDAQLHETLEQVEVRVRVRGGGGGGGGGRGRGRG